VVLEAAGSVRVDRRRFIMTDPDWPRPGPAALQAALARITRMKKPPAVWDWLACVSDTEVYLRITTTLLQEANTRFHAFAEGMLPAAGDQS
jgi:hypothetical protein